MKTRAEIIEELYNSPDFDALLKKLFPTQPDLQGDLRQEAMLVICEMPEARLKELYNNGGKRGHLRGYFLGTVRLMAASKYSRFYYQYRKKERLNLGEDALARCGNDPEDCVEMEQKKEVENIIHLAEDALKKIGKVRWYDETLFRLYVQLGCNSTKVSRETMIPRPSVVATVNRVLCGIRQHINEKKKNDGNNTFGGGFRGMYRVEPVKTLQLALPLAHFEQKTV